MMNACDDDDSFEDIAENLFGVPEYASYRCEAEADEAEQDDVRNAREVYDRMGRTLECTLRLCDEIYDKNSSIGVIERLLYEGAVITKPVFWSTNKATATLPYRSDKLYTAIEVAMKYVRAGVIHLFCVKDLVPSTLSLRIFLPLLDTIDGLLFRLALYNEFLNCLETLHNVASIVNDLSHVLSPRSDNTPPPSPSTERVCSIHERDIANALMSAVRHGVYRQNVSAGVYMRGVLDLIEDNPSMSLEIRVDGETPLLAAARTLKKTCVMHLLLRRGARTDACNAAGQSPLHVALNSLLLMTSDGIVHASRRGCDSDDDYIECASELESYKIRYRQRWSKSLRTLRSSLFCVRVLFTRTIDHEKIRRER